MVVLRVMPTGIDALVKRLTGSRVSGKRVYRVMASITGEFFPVTVSSLPAHVVVQPQPT
jgi:hypothetical protein